MNELLLTDNFIIPLLRNIPGIAGSSDFPHDFIYPECVPRNAILFLYITPCMVNEPPDSTESYDLGAHPFFAPYREISHHCSTPFGFLELHTIRETRTQRAERIKRTDSNGRIIGTYHAIANRLISEAMPETIVVVSPSRPQEPESMWIGSKLILDPQGGAHQWNGIPTFFTPPFSGANATDSITFQLLKKQIGNALRGRKLTNSELL